MNSNLSPTSPRAFQAILDEQRRFKVLSSSLQPFQPPSLPGLAGLMSKIQATSSIVSQIASIVRPISITRITSDLGRLALMQNREIAMHSALASQAALLDSNLNLAGIHKQIVAQHQAIASVHAVFAENSIAKSIVDTENTFRGILSSWTMKQAFRGFEALGILLQPRPPTVLDPIEVSEDTETLSLEGETATVQEVREGLIEALSDLQSETPGSLDDVVLWYQRWSKKLSGRVILKELLDFLVRGLLWQLVVGPLFLPGSNASVSEPRPADIKVYINYVVQECAHSPALDDWRVVHKGGLVVRRKKSCHSEHLGTLPCCSLVQLILKGRHWSLIRWPGGEGGDEVSGYVFSRYLKPLR